MTDKVREFWTAPDSVKVHRFLEFSEKYDEVDPLANEDALFLDTFVAPRYAGRTVLEIGAGTGRMISTWAKHNVKLTSSEFSPAFLPRLCERSEKFGQECAELDIVKGHLDRKFDLIFSTRVLLHIHPREIRAAIANIKAMAGKDLLLFIGGIGPPFDGEDSERISSFRHDYDTLFAEAGLKTQLDMTLTYRARKGKNKKINRVFFLSV